VLASLVMARTAVVPALQRPDAVAHPRNVVAACRWRESLGVTRVVDGVR
jgi:hypothetical protein